MKLVLRATPEHPTLQRQPASIRDYGRSPGANSDTPGLKRTSSPRRLLRGARAALRLLVWAAIAGFVCLLGAALLPAYTGYHQVTIYGGSMGAALPLGSVAVTRTIDAGDVHVGDIIAVSSREGGATVLHRVVSLDRSEAGPVVTTRGDANATADPVPRLLTGRGDRVVYHIPLLGYVVHYSRTMPGPAILGAAVILALLSLTVPHARRAIGRSRGGPSRRGSRFGVRRRRRATDRGNRLAVDRQPVAEAGPLSFARFKPQRCPGSSRKSGMAPDSGHPQNDPVISPRRLGIAPRSGRAAAVIVALALVGLAWPPQRATAQFSEAASIGGNAFTADTLNAPTGANASVSCTSVTVAWTATSDTYAAGHRVFRSATSGSGYTQIAQVTPRSTTSYVDAPGTGTWYYVVRAYYQNWESANSSEVSATVSSSGIAFCASASSGAQDGDPLVINKPTGTVANHFMIASIIMEPSTITITPPIGWILIRRTNQSASDPSALAVYYKVAGGSEPSTYTWTFGAGSEEKAGGIMTFSGVNSTSPVNIENGQATASSLSHATPNVTTTVANTIIVTSHGMTSSTTWTAPAGMAEEVDQYSHGSISGSGVSLEMNFVLQGAAGATGTKTAVADSNNDAGVTHILALAP